MADPISQSKGHLDSKDESTDKQITQNIPEINVHHKVEEGVRSSGQQQQNSTNTSAAVTLKHDGEIIGSDRQEVEYHHSVSGEQEVECHPSMSDKQEVQSDSSMSGEQEVESHSSVSGEQEVQSHSSVSGEQEVEPHSSVSGEQVVVGDIFEAAQSGNIVMVENYLDLGFPPDLTDEEGWSILHHAASHGQVEVIKFLHERGCCIDPVDRHGRTPLHHAATSEEAASIGVLVDLGSNVNTVDSEGNTPLKWAVMCEKYSTLEELLKYGGVEDVECEQREEPSDEQRRQEFIAALDDETVRDLLVQSASTGDVQTVSAILDHGCPVDAVDRLGYTALHGAVIGGHIEVIRELIARGASVGVQGSDGTTPLHHAANFGKLEVVCELLRLGGKSSMTMVAGIKGTPLHQAAFGGHKEVVLVLLDAGCPIDVLTSDGQSALHLVAGLGHVDLLGLLVERGLDINRGDADGYTSLHSAAQYGQLEAVHELLRLGGKPSITKVASTGGTPLHQAVLSGHKEIVLVLLGAGCPIDVVTSVGQNILHFAAQGGHVDLLGLFVEHGLDVNGGDTDGYTPLHSAAANGKLEAVHELLRLGGNVSMTKVAGTKGTPLHQAALGGHKEVVLVLLGAGCPIDVVTSVGQNILHPAAHGGHVDLLGLFVEHGLDINGGDADGYTALHSAASNGKLEAVHELLRLGGKPSMTKVAGTKGTPLHQAALGGHKEVVLVLLGAGCPIDVVTSVDQNILHFAAQGGHVDLLGLFVERGLDVNGGDADGYTPLHSAAANGKLEAVHELLRLGGEPSITKVAGNYGAPLHQAVLSGDKEVVLVLLGAGCPIDVVTSVGLNVLHSAAQGGHVDLLGLFVEHGLDVNRGTADGYTPLHSAAQYGRLEAVLELLRLGGKASISKVAGTMGTPLHQAALGGHKEIVLVLLDAGCPIDVVTSVVKNILHAAAHGGHVDLLGLLVKRGLDVNEEDADGYTPLHLAAQYGQLEAVHELLRLGGKVSITKVAGTGGTPLHQAALGGHKEVVLVLLGAGCPIDVVTSVGQNILHPAAHGGHVDLLGLFVEHGLDINGGDADGYTALHSAASNGKLEAVHELLRLGGKPSMTKVAGTKGTPLHQAVLGGHKEVVLVLLGAGCPIDVVTSVGQNILHFAAQGGHVDLLGLFVERGLDVNGGDADGNTPLHFAAANDKLEAVHELLRLDGKASMTKVAGIYGTPLHQAALGGHKEVVLVLLGAGCPIDVVTSVGHNILHSAAQGGHVDLLGLFVEHGLDVNRGTADGYTPLHSAAQYGRLEAVHELLRLRANPTVAAGVSGTPLHQAICSVSVKSEVVSVISEAIEQYHSQHPVDTGSEVGSCHQLECAPDKNPLDCCNSIGQTPLMWAAGEGNVKMVKLLVSRNCSISARSSYDLSMFEQAIMFGQMNKLSEICKACGFDCGESIVEIAIFLKRRKLLDLSKILVMGAFTGDPLVLTTLFSEESIFTEAAYQTWSMTSEVLESYFPTVDIYHQLHLPEGCPLTSLHISLLTFKYTTVAVNCNNAYKRNAKDYKAFIEKLISHPLTKYTVNELFPNGLSSLDIAHRFDFHDIADMIEKAGGGPGLWANLPKEMEQTYAGAYLAVKGLIGYGEHGIEALSRMLSNVGYQSVGEESGGANRILQGRPSRSLVLKHVMSKLQHKDKWERVGDLLEVDEEELDRLGEKDTSDDEAYYSMLKYWLKHGRQVTWKTLLDAVGHCETKKTVDDMTNKIVEELAPLQVSLIVFHFQI